MSIERIVKCAKCGEACTWGAVPRGPFCSERCRMADLGSWLSEDYVIEGPPADGTDEQPGGPDDVAPRRPSDEDLH